MKADDYTRTIEVPATPAQCHEAIAHRMDQWWTTATTGNLAATGNILRVDFPPQFGFWEFRTERIVPNARIEMVCTDARHSVPGQPAEIEREWVGTRIVWEIAPRGSGTEITLTHHGLTPRLVCHGICLDGWDHFFAGSLKAYLETGTGHPHRSGAAG